MQHSILYKRPDRYALGPVPQLLPDGRLAVGVVSSPFADHYGMADWVVLVSEDQGETFTETDDPTIPLTWPGSHPRERYDRYADVQCDGTYLAAGTVGFVVWPKERREEAEALGFYAREHPDNLGKEILVGVPRVFVQRSQDRGQTWQRREWPVPGFSWLTAFPRWTRLQAGNILLPVYARNQDGSRGQNLVWRSDSQGDDWCLLPIAPGISDVQADETCFFEVAPGKILALMRHATPKQFAVGHLLESWSHDDGKTWDRTIILRDDAGTASTLWPDYQTRSGGSDVGYPITVQFADGSLFTCYWITMADGITHAAATRWRID